MRRHHIFSLDIYQLTSHLLPDTSNAVEVGDRLWPPRNNNRSIVLRRGQSKSPTSTAFDAFLAISKKLAVMHANVVYSGRTHTHTHTHTRIRTIAVICSVKTQLGSVSSLNNKHSHHASWNLRLKPQTYCKTPRGKRYPEPHLHPHSRTTRHSTNSPQQQPPPPEVHRGRRSAFRQILEWEKKRRHNFLGRAVVRIFRVSNFRGSPDVTGDGAQQTGRPSLSLCSPAGHRRKTCTRMPSPSQTSSHHQALEIVVYDLC